MAQHWHIWFPKADKETLRTWSYLMMARPFNTRDNAKRYSKTYKAEGKNQGSDLEPMVKECLDGHCPYHRDTVDLEARKNNRKEKAK